jgi:hypothetical protein
MLISGSRISAVSRKHPLQHFAGFDVRHYCIKNLAGPRRFGVYFSVCRIELGASARQIVLTVDPELAQHVGQARDNAFSHSAGRRRQFLPNMFGEQSRTAEILRAMN